MSDSLGAYLGHAAAPTHECCHACDEGDHSPGTPRTPAHYDSSCASDERIPSPNAPQLDWPLAVAILIEFPSPIDAAAPAPRSIGPAEHPPARADSSLLRLHCALTV